MSRSRPHEVLSDDCTVAHATMLGTALTCCNNGDDAMAADGSLDFWH